ncbi:MAG: hypothetical protein ACYTET_04740 [Planctomycetota bacterium]
MKMMRYGLVLAMLFCLSSLTAGKTIIEEGFFLNGIEGELTKEAKVDVWTFRADEAIVAKEDQKLGAKVAIRMLPCSVLEQMTSIAGEDNTIQVRLWALFTEYKDFNYLYSVFFLPVKGEDTAPEPQPEKTDDAEKENKTAEAKPKRRDSIIPTDILDQIESNKTPDLKLFQQVAKVTGDRNLIGRAGYLKQKDKVKTFQPDGFGQKVDKKQYIMLPCNMLETTEERIGETPGRQRYNVSGLVTRYKGRNYILLRRAARTYTHGNFTP